MNKKAHYQKVTVPTVFITKDKHRVKQYENNVIYLKDGDEFELELFNPTSEKVLAKIKLNDQYLGSGIILRPGERVFLERHFNEAKKFIFETYLVDKNNPDVQEAILDNGKVEVEFYEKQTSNIVWTSNTYTYTWPQQPSIFYTDSGGDVTCGNTSTRITGEITNTANFSADVQMNANMQETGRIEKGSESDQSFMNDSTEFNSYYTWNQTWTIFPLSQKTFVKEDLKVFCTNCGAKRKKDNHKFCPHCGNKF